MTIENTRIDTHFTYVFDDGRVHVLRDNQLVATNPQAAKVLIAAVGEIVELRHRLSRTLQEQDDHAEIDAPLDERVGDGKYRIIQTPWGTALLRHDQTWLDEDLLEMPELWNAVGCELRSLRQDLLVRA